MIQDETKPELKVEPQEDGRVIVRLGSLRPIICNVDQVDEAEKRLRDAHAKTAFFLGTDWVSP